MSVNRIGHMVGTQDLPQRHNAACQALDRVLRSPPTGEQLERWRREHPGEQPWLLVLDTNYDAVRQLMAAVLSTAHEMRPAGLWVWVVDRPAGQQAARFLAKDEEDTQAHCDRLAGFDAVAVCLAGGSMVITDIRPPVAGCLGVAERARRQNRSRRHAR